MLAVSEVDAQAPPHTLSQRNIGRPSVVIPGSSKIDRVVPRGQVKIGVEPLKIQTSILVALPNNGVTLPASCLSFVSTLCLQ